MRILLPAAFLLAGAGHAFGWGCEGHEIVALIARAHLTPKASTAIDQLLRDNPIDPAIERYCKERPTDLMADAATLADDTRRTDKAGSWHFIDVPLSSGDDAKLAEWCPPVGDSVNGKDRPGCVTNAIEYEWAILRDPKRLPADRALALRYVIHFIGDLHQPLHDSDNDDRGGNCTSITFFGEEKPANLHSIWDTRILQRSLAGKKATLASYAAALDTQFADRWDAWGTKGVRLNDWVWEGHRLAVEQTYGQLKPAMPFRKFSSTTDCNAERDKVAAMHISIADPYYKIAAPLVDEQLAKAGYRLAGLLNSTF